tara:strand:- start:692 stop:1144 length:453 start_codon:yes stop_codon:yes gene_type:complete
MSLEIIKISSTKTGILYKIIENNNAISIKLTNMRALFKPDKYYNNFYIKWQIDIENIYKILKIEKLLSQHFKKGVTSNIIKKHNYPLMLNTKFTSNKNNPIIIDGSLLSVAEFIETNLEKSYNITIEFGKIFVNDDTVRYPLIIRRIDIY